MTLHFEQFLDRAQPDFFLIVENPDKKFLQFTDLSDGTLEVDLPTHLLTPRQVLAAEQLLIANYEAKRYGDCNDPENFYYKFRAPALSEFLTLLTIEVFERVYGSSPTAPFTFKIGKLDQS